MLNKQQMAYLESLGLPSGAGDVQIKAFVATISAMQVKFLNGLGDRSQEPGARSQEDSYPATGSQSPAPVAQATPAPVAQATPAPAPGVVLPVPAVHNVEAQIQAAVARERGRTAHIRTVAAQLGLDESWSRGQIDGGFTVEQVNAAALNQAAANRAPVEMGSAQVTLGLDRHAAAVGQGLIDAVLIRAGGPLLEVDSGTGMPVVGRTRQPHQMAGRFRGNSLMMAQQFLGMCGRSTVGMSAPEIARAVFVDCPRVNMLGQSGMMTSSDFPALLANAMGITMQQRYAGYPKQWPLFAVEAPAADLREQSIIRLGDLPILPEVKEGGEFTYVMFGEAKEVWTLVKRGHIVALSWEMILNDQLGAFSLMLAKEGDAASRTDDSLAFAVLTGNPAMQDTGLLFNVTAVTSAGGHANLVAHASGAVPSVVTLNAMNAAFGAQVGPKRNLSDTGNVLNISPGVIIVPRALEMATIALISAQYDPAGTAGTLPPNVWKDRLKVASHRLLDAQTDSAAWYCCTSPDVEPAMVLGYLEGYRGPQFQQESGFDTDTRKFKVSHFRVAKAVDWRLWYMNHGH